MLSVPSRWISSTAKRNLPSPKARKSVSSGQDIPLIDTYVDSTPDIPGNAGSDHKSDHKNTHTPAGDKEKPELHGEGKGQLVDYSV